MCQRRRSLGCSGSCSAVPSASVSPSLPRYSPFAPCGCCSLQPSMGLEELQYPLYMNARTGMNVWVHIFHMFQLNLPAAAHSGCRVSQRVHTSGSFPGEQWDGTLSTEGLCSHSVACEMLWMMENEELTLSWLRQQRTLPGAVYHSAAGVCFLQFFPSPCSFP